METQVRGLIKLTLIKMKQYNDMGSQYHQELSKPLHADALESSVIKVLSMDVKNDYQHLIMMTFVNDLISIFIIFPEHSKPIVAKVDSLLDTRLLELIEPSQLGKEVGNYYYLKKMEILKMAFEYKLALSETNAPFFSKLYNILRECLTTESNTTKEHYKITFVSIHKHIITHCKDLHLLDMVFNELVEDSLRSVEAMKSDETEAMRILDSRMLSILTYLGQSRITEKQLVQAGYLLVRASTLSNSYIQGLVLAVGEAVLGLLVNIHSPVTLIVLHHNILNPLMMLLARPTDKLYVDMLLNQVQYLFKNKRLLLSVLKLSDLNIHSTPLVETLVGSLYAFVEKEEKKQNKSEIFELVEESLSQIMITVKSMLDGRKGEESSPENQKLQQFYHVKEREYKTLVDKFNSEPKSLIKGQMSEYQLERLAHFLRKSTSINAQKMIECLGQPTDNSAKLRGLYLDTFNFKKYNIEESLRIMLSNFFLIGQSQQINRISEELANHLYNNNKDKMDSSDNVYLFCSALLILNTDLHNPMNEKKMTEADWLKMCSIVKGVTEEELLTVYDSILKHKIENFRDIRSLYKMNYTCFMYNYYHDKELWQLGYTDQDLKGLETNQTLWKYMAYDSLETILVGKKITKLDKLVDTWQYKEDVYECQILELLKILVSRGQQHAAQRVVGRILDKIDFNVEEVNPKSLSYYWLTCKVIIQHPEHISVETLCCLIHSTYRIRLHLEDDLSCRVLMKVKRIKDSLKWWNAKNIKKKGSILDIFANFLGEKESSDEEGSFHSSLKKPIAFKKLGAEVYDILGSTNQNRRESVQYFMTKIRDEKSKVTVGQFIFSIFMVFDLVCSGEDIHSFKMIEGLLNEILIDEDSSIGKRLKELQKRKQKKYQLILSLTKYYTVTILLEYPFEEIGSVGIAEAVLPVIQQCNLDLLKELSTKVHALKMALLGKWKENKFICSIEAGILKNIKENKYSEEEVRELVRDNTVQESCQELLHDMIHSIEANLTGLKGELEQMVLKGDMESDKYHNFEQNNQETNLYQPPEISKIEEPVSKKEEKPQDVSSTNTKQDSIEQKQILFSTSLAHPNRQMEDHDNTPKPEKSSEETQYLPDAMKGQNGARIEIQFQQRVDTQQHSIQNIQEKEHALTPKDQLSITQTPTTPQQHNDNNHFEPTSQRWLDKRNKSQIDPPMTEEDILRQEEQQLRELILGVSDENLEKLGLPIYML